jgi:hypothetical protein
MPTRMKPGRRRAAATKGAAAPGPAQAVVDDHADTPMENRLDEALKETFPASDPVAFLLRGDRA